MSILNVTYGAVVEQVDGLTGGSTTSQRSEQRIEHNECGVSAFYPLSPVQMSLYYALMPVLDND